MTVHTLLWLPAEYRVARKNENERALEPAEVEFIRVCVEHMGLAALLWGRGLEDYSLIHLCGHSVIKMTLFLVAGNILLAYGTRSVSAVGHRRGAGVVQFEKSGIHIKVLPD